MKDGGGEWERGEVDWRRKRREENKNLTLLLTLWHYINIIIKCAVCFNMFDLQGYKFMTKKKYSYNKYKLAIF